MIPTKDAAATARNGAAVIFSDPDVLRIFDQGQPPPPAYGREVAWAKRFVERWRGDDRFRAALADDPREAMARWGLEGEADDYRLLYDSAALAAWKADPQRAPASRVARRVWAFLQEKIEWREGLRRRLRVASPVLDAWRHRQILRCHAQLPAANAEAIVHAPVAIELARGCSVGCWFCGVSARKLTELWPYEPNRGLWRDVLGALAEVLGPAGGHGFLYWATDPLDNPDYERFCLDFHDVLGAFPQTTTALAHKDTERTRRLLELSTAKGCALNRFSVLTRGILDRLHAAFTPEELLFTELVQQNPQAAGEKSQAGKALEAARRKAESDGTPLPQAHASTIACVSGFLVNMPERRIRLISPCPSSDRWPDGYRTHADRTFRDGAHLREVLAEICSGIALRDVVRADDVVRLRPDVTVVEHGGDVRLQAPYRTLTLPRGRHPGALEMALRLVRPIAARDLVLARDVAPELTFALLNELNSLGVLDDEPLEVLT